MVVKEENEENKKEDHSVCVSQISVTKTISF